MTGETRPGAAACVERSTCRVCEGTSLEPLLDLGSQPLANNYLDWPGPQPAYPLCVVRCRSCDHAQLQHTVDPKALFTRYAYASGTSDASRAHFAAFARSAVAAAAAACGTSRPVVLDIACNDGSQLDEFGALGCATYGMDPAANLTPGTSHRVARGFWGVDAFPDLPTPDVVVAQNVVAHVPDPVLFLRACADVMGPRSRLYVQTSQSRMHARGEFDTVYHEHMSFFTVRSMLEAARRAGLSVAALEHPPVHGGSYLFVMLKGGAHAPDVVAAGEREADQKAHEGYAARVARVIGWAVLRCRRFSDRGVPVVAYGAAAKGMTFLGCTGLPVEYVVDDSPLKRGKFTPGGNVPIRAPEVLAADPRPELCVFVLAWNCWEEIARRVASLRAGRTTHLVRVYPAPETLLVAAA